MAQRHESTEVETHEAGIASDHDALRLTIDVDQARRSIGLKRGDGLLLLCGKSTHRLDLIHQRPYHWTDVVIEDRREIRVSVAGQECLKGRRVRQRKSSLTIPDGLRNRG